METYGFSYEHVWNALTFDQIGLYAHLATERERQRAEFAAFKTIELLAKVLG